MSSETLLLAALREISDVHEYRTAPDQEIPDLEPAMTAEEANARAHRALVDYEIAEGKYHDKGSLGVLIIIATCLTTAIGIYALIT